MAGSTARLIVFDDGKAELSPLTDLRAVFDVRVAALTNLERLERVVGQTAGALLAPDRLEALARDQLAPGGPLINEIPVGPEYLLVNARWATPGAELDQLELGDQLVEAISGDLIAMRGTIEDARALLRGQSPAGTIIDRLDAPALLSRPWHFKSFRDDALDIDLHLLARGPTQELPPGVMQIGEHPLTIHPEAMVYPSVVLDTELGPVVIDRGAIVRAGSVIIGPAYIGPGSTVLEHAIIKGHTAIGPRCKVAGEVVGCVFQGFSNKAHEGHLGDSWIGQWVNLGAGTVNSNLMNTYSEVSVLCTPGGSRERTGETFLGCILGDHVKTAIGTRIMTGAVVHLGAMLAASGPVDGCIPPFAWDTDKGRRVYRFDRFLDVVRTSMARREIEPSETCIARLRELHAAAARQHGSGPA